MISSVAFVKTLGGVCLVTSPGNRQRSSFDSLRITHTFSLIQTVSHCLMLFWFFWVIPWTAHLVFDAILPCEDRLGKAWAIPLKLYSSPHAGGLKPRSLAAVFHIAYDRPSLFFSFLMFFCKGENWVLLPLATSASWLSARRGVSSTWPCSKLPAVSTAACVCRRIIAKKVWLVNSVHGGTLEPSFQPWPPLSWTFSFSTASRPVPQHHLPSLCRIFPTFAR